MNSRLRMGSPTPWTMSRRAGYRIGSRPSAGKTSVLQPVKTAGVRSGSMLSKKSLVSRGFSLAAGLWLDFWRFAVGLASCFTDPAPLRRAPFAVAVRAGGAPWS